MDEPHLPTLFDAIARQRPRAAAIRTSTEATSWAELAARTDSLAAALVRAGVGSTDGPTEAWECPNDRVALYLHNHPAYLESMVAAWKARGTAMNVNYRYRAAELTELLEDAAPRAIVYHRCFTPTLSEVLGRLSDPPDLLICVADESEHRLLPGAVDYEELSTRGGAPPEVTRDAWSPDDRYLVYTGGTTGTPKGVLWRQCDFAVSALGFDPEAVERAGGPAAWAAGLPTPGPVTLPAPPFMHGAAHWNALAAWLKGGTVVLPEHPERFDADSLLDAVEWSGASALIIVGDAFARPLLAADEARHRGLPTLRHLLTGGAILSPSVKAELIRRWPHVTVVDVLGSSESGRQAVHRHRAATGLPGPSNAAVPGPDEAAVTAEPDARTFRPDDDTVIVDDAVARLVEPPTSHDGDSEVGWLARGGRVPLGYLGHPDQTRATFPVLDGRRLAVTGDRARYRSTGDGAPPVIELLGRASACINTGGEKVFAEEVEERLRDHPAIADLVVAPAADDRFGQLVAAVASLNPGASLTLDELRSFGRGLLADYKLPRRLLLVETVVRSPSGKPDYPWARQQLEGPATVRSSP